MTATAVDERTQLPGPTWPPSAPPPASFPLTDRRAVLADDPCEAGFSGADPKYAGMYLHARYFDPQLGTFLSPDPIGVEGGLNQYGYGFGDPVNSADRSGLGPDGGPDIPWWWIIRGLWGLFGGGDDRPPCNPFTCRSGSAEDRHPRPGTGGGPQTPGDGYAVPRNPSPEAPTAPTPIDVTITVITPPSPGPGGGSRRGPGSSSSSGFLSDPLFYSAQFCAGYGDCLTLNATFYAREWLGTNDVVDEESFAYGAGEWAGLGTSLVIGSGGGLRAAGSRAAGVEFSHWIPDRILKKTGSTFIRRTFGRSVLNGNYVTPLRHFRHDPFRYPIGWRTFGRRLSPFLAQLDRTPWVLRGTAAGATWGGAGFAWDPW